MVELTGHPSQGGAKTYNPDFEIFAQDIARSSDQKRLALSQRLKDAGIWKGKISSVFNLKYYTALLNLDKLYQQQGLVDQLIASTVPKGRLDVLVDAINDFESGEKSGSQTSIKISTPLEGRTLINKIFEDLLGRGATKAEFNKYYPQITTRQKTKPLVIKYSGGSNDKITTTGGPDVEEFLFQQIAGTDEAKQNKIFSFYDAFKTAIGVK